MRAPHLLRVVLLGALVLLASPAAAAPPSSAEGLPPDLLAYADATLALVAEGATPGAVVWIDSPLGTWQEAAGLRDADDATTLVASAAFEIGSVTKTMTGAVILQLVEEGLVDLDAPAATYIPEEMAGIAYGDTITVRHLLTHTAGLADYAGDLATLLAADMVLGIDEAMSADWTTTDLVAFFTLRRGDEPLFAPGEPGMWAYSNTGYLLLGLIIEAQTGMAYEDVLADRIFDPLGLQQTYVCSSVCDTGVTGYADAEFVTRGSDWSLSQAWAAGNVISTAPELATFVRALANGALFRDPATLALLGEGIEIAPGVVYGPGSVTTVGGWQGHNGQTLGFTTMAIHHAATDTVVVVWANAVVDSPVFDLTSLPEMES